MLLRTTLLVSVSSDVASVSLRNALLEAAPWEPVASSEGEVLRARDVYWVHYANGERMTQLDGVDSRFERAVGVRADEVVFLSRHAAASGTPALCVHPIGVAAGSEASHGGEPGRFPPPAPLLAPTYRALRRAVKCIPVACEATDKRFETSLEASHHGPVLDAPCCFVEIGSTRDQWGQRGPADLWARVLAEVLWGGRRWGDLADDEKRQATVVVGLGGGHYQPKLCDYVAANDDVFLGHMLASYALSSSSSSSSGFRKDASWRTTVQAAIDATRAAFPGATNPFSTRTTIPTS
ncbi:hypothetical protein CTAYLR_005504 [Chrysophaeum taylorii]|uniref:D-aminoacyl-tRNA deacylase n=1 Tax=Chrysophaeum taylorii TaxID=2483200 RepID=A0AAD7U4T8_9STRA|nr:hypothetical protein CTAYLR_005504 [Chrysophaeum taylorii]